MTEVERVDGYKRWLKPQYFISLILVIVILAAVLAVVLVQRNPVVATVNGEKITRNELYEAMLSQGGRPVLDDLIIRRLIVQEGKRMGLNVSGDEIDAEIDLFVSERFMGDEEQFKMVLEQSGRTLDGFKEELMLNLLANKIVEHDLEITAEEAEAYFAENRDYFDIPDEIEARHILVDTEEEAMEIITLLEEGEDFAELAKSRSQDPGSKDDGGNLGYFSRGQNVDEFDEAAFSLEVGQRSEPVETYFGYHVIEVLDRKDGRAVTFAEVEEQVREKIIEEKSPDLIRALIEKLHTEAEISYK